MSDHHVKKPGAAPQTPEERRTDLLSASLRRAFQTDLDAPVPEHMQQLIEALQKALNASAGPKKP